jgi:hypothetical protein
MCGLQNCCDETTLEKYMNYAQAQMRLELTGATPAIIMIKIAVTMLKVSVNLPPPVQSSPRNIIIKYWMPVAKISSVCAPYE